MTGILGQRRASNKVGARVSLSPGPLTTTHPLVKGHVMAGNQSTATPQVEYREIEGCPGYRVGSDGSVWSRIVRGGRYRGRKPLGDVWRELSLGRHRDGHLFANLRRKQIFVHRLVLLAFVGQCPPGMQCCHNDGNPSNNRLENLRWDTAKANAADAKRHGIARHADRHHKAKLNSDAVRAIRAEPVTTPTREMATRYGVSASTIRRARLGQLWRDAGSEPGSCPTTGPGERNHQAKLTDDQVRAIRAEYAAGGCTLKSLAVRYSVSPGLIGHIARRRAWRHLA